MIPLADPGKTAGNNNDNKDPFVVTPPRKHNAAQYTASTTPATPKSKSTPLHKRFLEEVTMSPETASTPPHTPTRSPKRGQTPKQTLVVGQNGFYFSMEIPEKKITPKRPATPDLKAATRATPSPQKRGEVKVGGRVKDILRKNLFGTPTKHTLKPGDKGHYAPSARNNSEEETSSLKYADVQSHASEWTESKNVSEDTTREAAIGQVTAPAAAKNSSTPSQASTEPVLAGAHPARQQSAMSTGQQKTQTTLPAVPTPTSGTTPALKLPKTSAASTPSNIGHLMANHSSKGSKVQVLPSAGGLESMPTPLRKMSERLGLRSPNVRRREKVNDDEITTTARPNEPLLRSSILVSDLHDAASVLNNASEPAATGEERETALSATSQQRHMMRVQSEQRLRQLLPSPITTAFPVVHSRPNTATTPDPSSPSTPSRPALGSRAKSFGTPSRLRSSMQEDMFKMQESLKRSFGPDAFQTSGSRATTPISPSVALAEPIPSAMTRPRDSSRKGSRPVSMFGPSRPLKMGVTDTKKTARPISRIGPPEAGETRATNSAVNRPLRAIERKPRPKSMIVGSARVLETVAAQIDSPRERAKLRSAAANSSSKQSAPTTLRPGTALSTVRAKTATTNPLVSKHQSPNCATKPLAHRHTAQYVTSKSIAKGSESASELASRTAAEQTDLAAPVSAPRKIVKAPSKPVPSRSRSRAPKTPEPGVRNVKNDSGTAQSYTPPGNPTRLPSPVKEVNSKRLNAGPRTPAPGPTEAAAAVSLKLVTEVRPAQTPFAKRLGSGLQTRDVNALRTPSKEVQSALDAAIDRKIKEDRERIDAGWF